MTAYLFEVMGWNLAGKLVKVFTTGGVHSLSSPNLDIFHHQITHDIVQP